MISIMFGRNGNAFSRAAVVVRYCVLLGVLLLAAHAASAATLSGTVYGNGTPMANAGVKLFLASDGSEAANTTTDSNGRYALVVADAVYNMLVTPPAGAAGYVNSPVAGISVAGSDITQNVALVTGATGVSGVVRLPDKTPVTGVQVTLTDQVTKVPVGEMITGGDGAYAFSVAPGTYSYRLVGMDIWGLSFPGAPRALCVFNALPNTVVSGNLTRDLVLPLAWLSGKTTNSEGGPVTGVEFQVSPVVRFKADGSYYYIFHDDGRSKSDAGGHYSIALFDGFTYEMSLNPPAGSGLAHTIFNDVSVFGDTTRDFALSASITLSGVVKLPNDQPLGNVLVTLRDETTLAQLGQVRSGAAGEYSFDIAPGSVRFNFAGSVAQGTDFTGSPLFFSVDNEYQNTPVASTMNKDLVVPFAFMTGKVVDGSGKPVAGVELQIPHFEGFKESNGAYYRSFHEGGRAVSDANGQYTLAVFKGFTYSITLVPPAGSGLATTVFSNIAVSGNATRDFTLLGANPLSGVVRLPDGTPVKGVMLTLRDQASGAQVSKATTQEDGAYSFGVASGTYKFDLWGVDGLGMRFPGNPVALNIYDGYPNTVVSGPTARDLVLPLAWLSGQITDSNGVPISGVALQKTGYVGQKADGSNYEILHDLGRIRSEAGGNYTMALFDGFNYEITVLPPANSGFNQSVIHNLTIAGPTSAGVVLQIPDTTPPRILSGPSATQIGTGTASIVWQTDEPASGIVSWSGGSASEAEYKTRHAITLSGLAAATAYTVTVSATDRSGNGPTTASLTFTTLSHSDSTPPLIITGPTASAVTHQSAVIEWETNEPATTQVTGDVIATVSGLRTHHRVALTGLSPQTSYSISVSSTDAAGNGPTVRTLVFTTLQVPDTTPPVIIKGPWSTDITSNAATIQWETDEPATSGVSYNDGVAYGVLNDDALTRLHSMRMLGLNPGTVYSVTVSSKDGHGNGPTLSPAFQVTTPTGGDSQPPVFVEPPRACNINHQLVHLCFRTDEPASVIVRYGRAADALDMSEARAQLIQQHSLPINGLSPGTTYYFQVLATDGSGNQRASTVFAATTSASGSANPPQFIRAPAASYQGSDRVVIEWETDRPCKGVVEYGIGNYALQATDGTYKTVHRLVVPNLAAGTTYQFRVRVTDMAGISAVDAP